MDRDAPARHWRRRTTSKLMAFAIGLSAAHGEPPTDRGHLPPRPARIRRRCRAVCPAPNGGERRGATRWPRIHYIKVIYPATQNNLGNRMPRIFPALIAGRGLFEFGPQ